MVKFSAAEGKKTRKRRCLPSSSCALSDSGEEDDDAGDASDAVGTAAVACREMEQCSCGTNGNSKGGKESATVIIDRDILDCPICYEIMNPPIFQCQNGHIACSLCCGKMSKCHSCSLPLGPTRCLALEKVFESIRLPCPYYTSGCTEMVPYSEQESHRSKCSKIPCHCPILNCGFSGSTRQLSLHLALEHYPLVADFSFAYNHPLTVSLTADGTHRLLALIASDGIMFFLINSGARPGRGSTLFMVCIGPDYLKGRFSYRLKASSGDSCALFESGVAVLQCLDDAFSPDFFLFVPPGFIGDHGRIMLDVHVLSISYDDPVKIP